MKNKEDIYKLTLILIGKLKYLETSIMLNKNFNVIHKIKITSLISRGKERLGIQAT